MTDTKIEDIKDTSPNDALVNMLEGLLVEARTDEIRSMVGIYSYNDESV